MTTMRRRMAMLVAVTAVSGVMVMFSPTTTPAQAVPHEVCAGEGNAHLASPFHYPGFRSTTGAATSALHIHPHSTTFTVHLSVGACAPSLTSLSAAGAVHGWCGLSVGSGTTSKGDNFHWVALGGTLVLAGGAKGVVNATPNTLAGDSCVTGADDFLAQGAVVRQSCGIVNQNSLSVASISLPNTSTSSPVSHHRVHTSGHLSVQYSFCY